MTKAGDILQAYEEELASRFYLEMHTQLTNKGFKCEPREGTPNYETDCPRSIQMVCYNEALSGLEKYVGEDHTLNRWNRTNLIARIRMKRYSERIIRKEAISEAKKG